MIDKSVIVTGASSGLGAHIARHLVPRGPGWWRGPAGSIASRPWPGSWPAPRGASS